MKKIIVKKVKQNLQSLKVDETLIDLTIVNIQLYNDMIDSYMNDKSNSYLLYQLGIQVFKMLQSIQKDNKVSDNENDTFLNMINEIKSKKIEKRG